MEKEKTTNTATENTYEQYVLDQLKKAEKRIELLEKQLKVSDNSHSSLVSLIIKGTKGFRLVVDESPDYDFLYFQNDFITTVWKDRKKNDKDLQALLRLLDAAELLIPMEK